MNEISNYHVSPDGNIYWVYKTDFAALLYPVIGCGEMFFLAVVDVIDSPPVLIVGKPLSVIPNNVLGTKESAKVKKHEFSFDHILN